MADVKPKPETKWATAGWTAVVLKWTRLFPKNCEIEYLDYNGEKKLLKAEGLLATCIQHEMDHLEGILFIDYLSKLKKSIIIKKLSKNKSNRIVV